MESGYTATNSSLFADTVATNKHFQTKNAASALAAARSTLSTPWAPWKLKATSAEIEKDKGHPATTVQPNKRATSSEW